MTNEIKEEESLLSFGNEKFSKAGRESKYKTLWDIYMPITKKIVAGENVSNKEIYRAKEIAENIFEKELNKRESKEY